MPDLENFKKHLPPPKRNILSYVQNFVGEVCAEDFAAAGFDVSYATSVLAELSRANVIEERFDSEKRKIFYSMKK